MKINSRNLLSHTFSWFHACFRKSLLNGSCYGVSAPRNLTGLLITIKSQNLHQQGQSFWNATSTFWKISSSFQKRDVGVSRQSTPTSTRPRINQNCAKHEKWSVISAAHLVFHSSVPLSQQIHLPVHLSGPLHLCPTALWSVASQVTWANRRLYIPARHCFALREFPPLSLPLSSLFVSVCSVA